MYCIHCGRELPDDAKFCKWCGKAVWSTENENPKISTEFLISKAETLNDFPLPTKTENISESLSSETNDYNDNNPVLTIITIFAIIMLVGSVAAIVIHITQ